MASSTYASQSQKNILPELDYCNISPVDLSSAACNAHKLLVLQCLEYGLSNNFKSKDTKRLFYNFFILEIFKVLKNTDQKGEQSAFHRQVLRSACLLSPQCSSRDG